MSKGMRPNVLLLFSDQHKASVLGCENHPDAITPNLDRLAEGGMRFERAYCQDAICVPSRCSMMTGLYPRTLGCLGNSDRSRPMEQAVKNCIEVAARGSAFILSTGCEVPFVATPENVRCFMEAAEKHGYYQ